MGYLRQNKLAGAGGGAADGKPANVA